MSRRVLAERTVGTQLVAGTEWAIVDQLVRDQRPGQRPSWQVVLRLCNGVPRSAEDHKTRTAAVRSYEGAL